MNTFWITCAGSVSGAGAIVLINYIIDYKAKKMKNFRSIIAIQLSLNLILSELLQNRVLEKSYENNFKPHYNLDSIHTSPDVFWNEFRHIDLQRIDSTFSIADQDWDLSQLLSKNIGDHRKLLEFIIPARACYLHIICLLKKRNSLHSKALEKLNESYEAMNNENYIYSNNNLIKIIGMKLNFELKSITDTYLEKQGGCIAAIHEAFNEISNYIKTYFSGYDPLDLTLEDNLRNDLKRIVENGN